jgi:rare lipoprotein A
MRGGRRVSGVGRASLSFRARRGVSADRGAEIPHCVRYDTAGISRWLAVLVIVGVLAACGTARPPASPSTAPSGSTSAPSPRGGGYYQDDGPPAQVPIDLSKVPDAVPRVEAPHRFANRPYTALGRDYTPLVGDTPLRQRGLASWYGRQFHGNRTSSGELYDMFAMSAAHPTMQIPSFARVTNLRSGASVIVRVNDRGPFKDNRIIDLSYAAAVRLGYIGSGTAEVEVERITNADIAAGRCCGPAPATLAMATPPPPAAEPTSIVAVPVSAATPTTGGRWSVQVGAFAQAANAAALRERIAVLFEQSPEPDLASPERMPRVEQDGAVHRVLIGSFAERGAAQQFATRIERLLARETVLYAR